jgi:hypothetical protein
MLGHIKPPICRLRPQAKEQYRHLYCSMCYSLRRQFGLPAGLLISHELTIGLLACADGFSVPLEYRACPAQLFCRQRAVIRHETVDKAARLNLLLVWLKLIDWETDSRKFYGGFVRKIAESRVRLFWSELSAAARDFIDGYLALIKSRRPDFSAVREHSGLLANCLFDELTPRQEGSTEKVLALVGEIIPVADALLDLKQDIGKNQYNPVIAASREQAIPLAEAYRDLHTDYRGLAGRINALLSVSENALFAEVLSKSLANLSARIDRQGYFAGPADNRDGSNDSQSRKKRRQTGDSGQCCDCGDCCNCCECISGSSRTANAACCDSCGCGDGCCGNGCDCCGCDCSC